VKAFPDNYWFVWHKKAQMEGGLM